MAGSLTIPTVLANLATGNQPLSTIDTNFSAIATYVNVREVAFGVFAARPAAGVAGRWYFATDTTTLYVDDGVSWHAVTGAAGSSVGGYMVRRLVGLNTAGFTTARWDMSADLVQLRAPSGGAVVVRTNTGTLTNNTATAGPTAGGRDQAGVFAASNWLHFYFIWNGTTLATLASLTAPPTGPTLPSGYTHWAYAGAVYWNASSQLVQMYWRGARAYFQAPVTVGSSLTATSETAVPLPGTAAPANALAHRLHVTGVNLPADISTLLNLELRLVTGATFVNLQVILPVDYATDFPLVAGQILYLWSSAPTHGATIASEGFVMPNGGE